MRRSSIQLFLSAALLLGLATVARADLSKGVQAKLKGKIVISADELPAAAEDDAATLRALKKAAVSQLKHSVDGGVATWRLHFLAFMTKKPGATMVSLDFYLDDKSKAFVAQKRLAGIDPGLTTLQARVDLTEDDGLSPNKNYVVKLAAQVKGREVILATTKLRTR
jgi:hypothetical protein